MNDVVVSKNDSLHQAKVMTDFSSKVNLCLKKRIPQKSFQKIHGHRFNECHLLIKPHEVGSAHSFGYCLIYSSKIMHFYIAN